MHIDYGFMLQNSPGGWNFEMAPFKLTQEYIDLMDGIESDKFENFKSLINAGLAEIKKHIDELESLVMILAKGKFKCKITNLDTKMPCILRPETLMYEIKERLKS